MKEREKGALEIPTGDDARRRQKTPITGEELQVKFLSDSGENSLKY